MKKNKITYIFGSGRNNKIENNDLIKDKLNWNYEMSLSEGLEKTYGWINEQVNLSKL